MNILNKVLGAKYPAWYTNQIWCLVLHIIVRKSGINVVVIIFLECFYKIAPFQNWPCIPRYVGGFPSKWLPVSIHSFPNLWPFAVFFPWLQNIIYLWRKVLFLTSWLGKNWGGLEHLVEMSEYKFIPSQVVKKRTFIVSCLQEQLRSLYNHIIFI